jgi:hypothetical protein
VLEETINGVEMKLDCGVFLWKLSFLKTLEITTPLKSGPYGAQPLIFNKWYEQICLAGLFYSVLFKCA